LHLLLTDRFCDRAKATTQTDYFDETVSGLALRVTPLGVKAWTFLYTAAGKRRRITLGRYPAVSLASARTLALEARAAVAAGQDPSARGAMTIADLVESYIAKHTSGLRSGPEIERRIRKNIIPIVGNVPLAELHRRDATRVVDAVTKRGAPTEAARAFEDLRAMLRWAVARGDLDHNPIDGMRKPPSAKPRERVLTDDEIRALWLSLPTALAKSPTCQRIIRLCLLTGQRVGEVAGMRRGELDFKTRTWSLPGTRTKNGHGHVVPLSEGAMGIIGEPGKFVFPSGDGPLPPMAVAKTIERAQDRFGIAQWTAHDLRRTALTGMAKLGVAPLVLGHIANHRTTTKAGMTLSVYVHHAYEREKREALELWADRLRGIIAGADVVPMQRPTREHAPPNGRGRQ
jgi:integrase